MPEATQLIKMSKLPSFSAATIPHPLATLPPEDLWHHAEVLMGELERILEFSDRTENVAPKEPAQKPG